MKTITALLLSFFMLHYSSSAQSIAAGGLHSFAVCSDNVVQIWGNNMYGQLGNAFADSHVPIQVTGLSNIVAVSGGLSHSLALKTDGTVWAWGFNGYGQLGNGTANQSNVPVQTNGLSNITAIAGGGYHSLALKSDGTVWAWGYNFYGQLGNGSTTDSNFPVQVSGLTGVIAITAGLDHSYALKNDGTVWAWGWNNNGQLGNGNYSNATTPVQVNGLAGITAIASGWFHSLALKNDGTVWSWGYNNNGQLGDGTAVTNKNLPVQVSGLAGIISIAGGGYHSLAVENNGNVWSWGCNNCGQLGSGNNNANSNLPVSVVGISGAVSVACGVYHSIALKNDGTIGAWGYNAYGQLGNGNTTNTNFPVAVNALCPVAVREIAKPATAITMNIYPNPSNGKFTVEQANENSEMSLEVYNAVGEKIFQSEIHDRKSEVDLSDQPNGIYFVTIKTAQETFTQKIVIQK